MKSCIQKPYSNSVVSCHQLLKINYLTLMVFLQQGCSPMNSTKFHKSLFCGTPPGDRFYTQYYLLCPMYCD